MGTTADLARFIAETQYDDLPAAVVAAAKIGILDGVSNLLAGSTQPVGIDSFSDATRFTPVVDEALTKVRLRHNPALGRGANAIVTLKDGRVLKGECRDFRGSIRNPMTRDEHDVKYRDCAKRVLPPEDIDRVRDMVENLERLADIRQLIALLAPRDGVGVG
jgi:2-methylcitrate dehydratase PrpD